MRVAVLGNMNNMGFAMVRHLRAAGLDTTLFLFDDTPPHFHPSKDTFHEYESFTVALPFGSWHTFAETPRYAISDAIAGHDFTIGMGTAPALMHRAGRRLDVFFPYGDDILSFPFWLGTPSAKNWKSVLSLPYHQREGIRDAAVCIGAKTPRDDALYAKLGYRGKRVAVVPPLVCSIEFAPERMAEYHARSEHYPTFARIRAEADFMAMSHSRVAVDQTVNYKGTEKLADGFAAFVKAHPEKKIRLAMLEYGPDVGQVKERFAAHGVESSVHWLPLMARRDILVGLSLADVTFGELGYSFLSGGAISECAMMGKPMIHYRDDALYAKADLFPVLHAATAEDVTERLEECLANPEHAQHVGAECRRVFNERMVDLGVDVIGSLVHEKEREGRVAARDVDPSLFLELEETDEIPSLGNEPRTDLRGRIGATIRRALYGF